MDGRCLSPYQKGGLAPAMDGRCLSPFLHRSLRELFGSRVDWLGCGGAPLPWQVAELFQAARLPILQGYGLTESSPVITRNRKEQNKLGTVGQAVPGVEVAIAADGEILNARTARHERLLE